MSSSSSPIELTIPAIEPWDSYAQNHVRHCIRPSEGLSTCLYIHHAASYGVNKKKTKNFYFYFSIEQVLEATPHKAAAIRPPTTYHENYQS